ncbi:membrane protein [gut metagenome]|uniref:Membrane protein n=1 Tax=gut metagenome TaxID=749906 RepID=J9G6B3_9ZZZZ
MCFSYSLGALQSRSELAFPATLLFLFFIRVQISVQNSSKGINLILQIPSEFATLALSVFLLVRFV